MSAVEVTTETRAWVRPRDESGHEWVQRYTVRIRHGAEVSVPLFGGRYCRRCLVDPMQIVTPGPGFEPCQPKITQS